MAAPVLHNTELRQLVSDSGLTVRQISEWTGIGLRRLENGCAGVYQLKLREVKRVERLSLLVAKAVAKL